MVDIAISRHWLHLLAWQLSVKYNALASQASEYESIDYPLAVARNVLAITSAASQRALDAHGIGMEQKLTDIATGVLNMLQVSGDAFPITRAEGRIALNALLLRLGDMRGAPSRYLPGLLVKASHFLSMAFDPRATLPMPRAGPYSSLPCASTFGFLTEDPTSQDEGTTSPLHDQRCNGYEEEALPNPIQWAWYAPTAAVSRRPSGKVIGEADSLHLYEDT